MAETKEEITPSVPLRFGVAGTLVLIFAVLDRITKIAIVDAFNAGVDLAEYHVGNIVGLAYAQNTGAAFSLGEGQGLLFVVFAAVVCVACVVYLAKTPKISLLEAIGMGMLMGGALGNAFDRVAYGYVIDFIKTLFISFPIFNVADIGVTCGVVLAFIGYLFLSPAAREVDATAELNRRDAAKRERKNSKDASKRKKSGDKDVH